MGDDRLECFICDGLDGSAEMPWHDRPLLSERGIGSVVAGIGPFCPGYVLISPSGHVDALARIPERDRPSFRRFVVTCLDMLAAVFGEVTYWEHGGSSPGRSHSACLDHAHLHVIPGGFEEPPDLPRPGVVYHAGLGAFLGDPGAHERTYLLFGTVSGQCRVTADVGVSQYFRRRIAIQLGIPDEWDYAAVPRYDVVRMTIDLIEPILRGSNHGKAADPGAAGIRLRGRGGCLGSDGSDQ